MQRDKREKKKLEAESFTGFIKKLIFLYVIKFTQCMYMCVVIFNVTSQTKEKYLITKWELLKAFTKVKLDIIIRYYIKQINYFKLWNDSILNTTLTTA